MDFGADEDLLIAALGDGRLSFRQANNGRYLFSHNQLASRIRKLSALEPFTPGRSYADYLADHALVGDLSVAGDVHVSLNGNKIIMRSLGSGL
jgi:hypothetical protein